MAKVEIDPSALEGRLQDAVVEGKISFNPRQLSKWRNAGYGIVGHHSAVEICHWTKSVIRGKGGCYKVKFYGIDAHRCAQMSPAAAWCNEGCVFCWRPMEWYSRVSMDAEMVDDPEEIISGVVEERRKLLSGFLGNPEAVRKVAEDAYYLFPSHWAISLSGEPTIYPKLGEMIVALKRRRPLGVRSIFVVSNGQLPEVFEGLRDKKELPTQLYISLTAHNEEMFRKVNRSIYKDGWQRLLTTLHDVLPTLPTRRVIRFTLIKGVNDSGVERYAEIMEKSKADYIEVKAYMWLGQSMERLKRENMPSHDYVKAFAEKLLEHMPSYAYKDEEPRSRIVVLKRKDSPFRDYISSPEALDTLREDAAIPKEWPYHDAKEVWEETLKKGGWVEAEKV